MTNDDKSAGKTAPKDRARAEREARLKAALRANLRRRKASGQPEASEHIPPRAQDRKD